MSHQAHPEDGAPDLYDGDDYYYPFDTYEGALEFSQENDGAEDPLALIEQLEYIEESNPGKYEDIKQQRITEWPIEFLKRPKRTEKTIPNFLSPNAPSNRLEILRDCNIKPLVK